jgi:hypothetical protein
MNPQMNVQTNGLLNEDATALVLSCSVALLRKMRRVGNGPSYCRIGRLVRYPQADLVAFIEAKKERAVTEEEHADLEAEKDRVA